MFCEFDFISFDIGQPKIFPLADCRWNHVPGSFLKEKVFESWFTPSFFMCPVWKHLNCIQKDSVCMSETKFTTTRINWQFLQFYLFSSYNLIGSIMRHIITIIHRIYMYERRKRERKKERIYLFSNGTGSVGRNLLSYKWNIQSAFLREMTDNFYLNSKIVT